MEEGISVIVDNITSLLKYEGVLPYVVAVNDFVTHYFKKPLPLGTYEIDGENCFAFVQEYEPEEACTKNYESHNQYIDLQIVVNGTEKMLWATLDKLKLIVPFQTGSDCAFYKGEDVCPLVITANEFAVFFPHDGHKPGCRYNDCTKVTKLVIKIKA